jgi:GT2 family glycosyltransferase
MAADRVSVLVVTYDHADEIAACLDAALAQEAGDCELEVVVVDNASSDGTAAVVRGYGDRVRLIERERNTGFADGVNAAFAASAGELVLFLNPDVVMDEGCIAALRGHLHASPETAAAAALLRDVGGGLQRFARREPDVRAVAWTMTQLGRRIDAKRGGKHLLHRRYETEWRLGVDRPLAVECPAAACVLVRRSLCGEAPFDSGFPLFFNDAELWRRLRADGWSIDVVPGATAEHGYGTSVQRLDQDRMRAEWVVSVRRYLRSELGPARRAALTAVFAADVASAWLLERLGRGEPGTREQIRGTLGGLGLPGGVSPWLSPAPRPRAPWRT